MVLSGLTEVFSWTEVKASSIDRSVFSFKIWSMQPNSRYQESDKSYNSRYYCALSLWAGLNEPERTVKHFQNN